MPNKTIYVSDDDLPLFERAQELSGANLSAAIVRALRRFIELEEAKQRGFDEITVIVNTEGAHRRKRFLGQRLVRWLQPTANGKGTEILNVYRTAGNRYALHTRSIADWELAWGDPDIQRHPNNFGIADGIIKRFSSWGYDDWDTFKTAGDYTLEVFDTLEELKARVSSDLRKAISLAMEGPEIEDLDI
ncbi:MAG TPA: EXLDI protein [Phototrophicaceae bacterium]|nr:EXLDI protein [Phototrophicaceae bacterium]